MINEKTFQKVDGEPVPLPNAELIPLTQMPIGSKSNKKIIKPSSNERHQPN